MGIPVRHHNGAQLFGHGKEMRVAIHGDRELAARLKHMSESALKRIMRPAARAGASVINKAAKAKAKTVSKSVSKSIGVKAKTYSRSGTVWVGVGPRTGEKYHEDRPGLYWGSETTFKPHKVGPLLEYGTKPHQMPWGWTHPGTAPQPFLRPAWDASKDAAYQKVRAKAWYYLRKELGKTGA